METGVYEVHVPRRVIVATGHDLDHVTIQHLQMVVPIAQETRMTRHNAVNQHGQVFMSLLSLFRFLH